MSYPTPHKKLIAWVEEIAQLTTPDRIHWCDGFRPGVRRPLPAARRSRNVHASVGGQASQKYYATSDPNDVARVEDRTFICSKDEKDAGPTNNWRDPVEMREVLNELFEGSMKGRTMYVVPFSMGPLGSDISHIGVELTDSAYVAVNMKIMTRMGTGALEVLGEDGEFGPACTRSACLSKRVRPTCAGPATTTTSTLSTSPRPARSSPTARVTAAMRYSARSVSRCASRQSSRVTTAWLAETERIRFRCNRGSSYWLQLW